MFITRRRKKNNLKLFQINYQAEYFTKQLTIQESAAKVDYMLSYKLVKQSKPFCDGELLKYCVVEAPSILCPDNKRQFENVPVCPSLTLSQYGPLEKLPTPALNHYAQFLLLALSVQCEKIVRTQRLYSPTV